MQYTINCRYYLTYSTYTCKIILSNEPRCTIKNRSISLPVLFKHFKFMTITANDRYAEEYLFLLCNANVPM